MPTEAPFQVVIKGAVDQLSRSLYDLGAIVSTSIDKAGTYTTDQIVNVIGGGLVPVMQQIYASMRGPFVIVEPDNESDVYRGFSGSITGTTPLKVWEPADGKKFLLKGYAVAGIVSPDVLAASAGVLIYFSDGGNSEAVVAPIATIHKTAAADVTAFATGGSGTSVTGTPVVINLGSGRRGSVAGSSGPLNITTDITIGTGDIKLVGVAWGRETSFAG